MSTYYRTRRIVGVVTLASSLGLILAAPVNGSLVSVRSTAVNSTTKDVATTTSSTKETPLRCATALVTSWSVPQLAREIISVSVTGTQISTIETAVQKGFGALLLFGSTGSPQLPTILHHLAATSPHHFAPLVMSDEEGGAVIRLGNFVGTWPWAQVMGRTMTPGQIRALAVRVAMRLRAVGITVDLAPVVDIDGRAVVPGYSNPDGLRAFSGRASVVAADAAAFAAGLRAGGVVAVLKHFPGLGGTSPNTDVGPASTRPWSTLAASVGAFVDAVNEGTSAVMMSNAIIPGLTSVPATLSHAAVAALRARLHFDGLIMTDALSAVSVTSRHLSVAQASLEAVKAGEDLILDGTPVSGAQSLSQANLTASALVSAVQRGALTRATLIAAAAEVVSTLGPCSPPTH